MRTVVWNHYADRRFLAITVDTPYLGGQVRPADRDLAGGRSAVAGCRANRAGEPAQLFPEPRVVDERRRPSWRTR